NLATTFESPSIYNSDNEDLDQPSNSLDELHLPRNITSILLNDNFWQTITRLCSLLLPYCGALNSLQSDTARLYDVLKAFEQKWRQWEQPLLLLAFLLNPNIHISWFNSNSENLNFAYLAQFVTYYYKAWFGHRPI
ncbi:25466_t:CDS:2, partial [Gigaspora rosea]